MADFHLRARRFNSAVYTLFYTVTTSTSSSFKTTYGLSETEIGLCFLSSGTGCLSESTLHPLEGAPLTSTSSQSLRW